MRTPTDPDRTNRSGSRWSRGPQPTPARSSRSRSIPVSLAPSFGLDRDICRKWPLSTTTGHRVYLSAGGMMKDTGIGDVSRRQAIRTETRPRVHRTRHGPAERGRRGRRARRERTAAARTGRRARGPVTGFGAPVTFHGRGPIAGGFSERFASGFSDGASGVSGRFARPRRRRYRRRGSSFGRRPTG